MKRHDWWAIGIISAVSLLVHIIFFGHPANLVFDEVHLGNFMSSYLQGEYFFDTHPPFARLMVVFLAIVAGTPALLDYSSMSIFVPSSFVILRIIPVVCGILFPLVLYGALRKLNAGVVIAGMVALLVCLENSLIVQSLFLLTDIMLICAGFAGMFAYFSYCKSGKVSTGILAIVFAAIALSIKWTGGSFLLLILLAEALRRGKKSFGPILAAVGIAALFYIGVFVVHFYMIPRSGVGDAFMTPQFQKTLEGNEYEHDKNIEPHGFAFKFIELNAIMYSENVLITQTHPDASLWYQWPVMLKPIPYWARDFNYIYFIGNPFIYWAGLLAVFALLGVLGIKMLRAFKRNSMLSAMRKVALENKLATFAVAGWLINFVPFIFIGRTMFMYHYLVALVFCCIAIGACVAMIRNRCIQYIVVGVVLLASATLYFYFAPLTYGLQLAEGQFERMMWFEAWK